MYYIEYLNKDKNFRQDKVTFETEEEAIIWGKENLENFNMDMIRMNFNN